MPSDKSLSFTATLLANGHPVIILNEATDRPVNVAHHRPDPSRPSVLDASHALGILIGPNEAWEEDRNLGLIDFNLIADIPPTELYFRHHEGHYRLYVRSGKYLKYGVFTTNQGVTEACPIKQADPILWALRCAQTGQAIDLSNLASESAAVNLVHKETAGSLGMHGIGIGVGGFLAVDVPGVACDLRLNILEREVDWLSAS
ncbi:hypothetical protein [Pseudomonas sp. H9]|uniref:hypothetical protein n=1 Tax=Pseudomonas sp. H9 TaxID=483968 RepID=UPI001057F48F|nr:hypothetical protein [Pseudomonas sp. H9]TDF82044.1 hypothetical protein E1573_15645 [Pseudomonas sp. H9]